MLVDLSHTIENELITYKGLPAPIVCDYWSREESGKNFEDGSSFHIGKIEMVTNTGTYLDCPFHRFEDGSDLSEIVLDQLIDLECVKITVPEGFLDIGVSYFRGLDLESKAVLVHTNWSKNWNTSTYFENHPFLTQEAAEFLVSQKVRLVGIDSHNIDDTRTKKRPVHTTLLKNNILIVEHLTNLDQLPESNFKFTAVPPKWKGLGTFPVRAFAKI